MTSMVHYQPPEGVMMLPENFRKKLAIAVRSIQWSYAIFWATRQPGSLEWFDGYYNGDIKTRRTTQARKLKADKIALQRSEQLRELYLYLLEEESAQQSKRPASALSPEDLSDGEWYFLVCMSFVFSPGQGLPIKTFTENQTVWLCHAHNVESTVFSRSLLAKSASIKTVVCFPHFGGVIEIGVTELIAEDPELLQHFGTCLLDISKPICIEYSLSSHHSSDDDKDPLCVSVKGDLDGADSFDETNEMYSDMNQELSVDSLKNCSQENDHEEIEESLIPVNKPASLDERRHLTDDEMSKICPYSMACGDSMPKKFMKVNNPCSSLSSKKSAFGKLKELKQKCDAKSSTLDLPVDEDVHYKTILLEIKNYSNPQRMTTLGKSSRCGFETWQKCRSAKAIPVHKAKENTLKRILNIVLLVCNEDSSKFHAKKLTNEDNSVQNQKFQVSKTLVPHCSKDSKVSVVDHMIRYIQDLETRVVELESCMDLVESNPKLGKYSVDLIEQTSDNYESKNLGIPWTACKSKRKASDHDEYVNDQQKDYVSPVEVKVSMEEDILIEMKCPYREYILLDIMDQVNRIHLEAHSVQSSNHDGILMLTMKSKFRGTSSASASMIKQSLWKIANEDF